MSRLGLAIAAACTAAGGCGGLGTGLDVLRHGHATITNSPTVTAYGQGWKDQADDAIAVEAAG